MGVASNSITIYKATDVVRSDTAPSDTSKVWVDTSLDPPALKTYDTDGKVWRSPSELELLAMNEIIESHTTELNVVKGNISTLIVRYSDSICSSRTISFLICSLLNPSKLK